MKLHYYKYSLTKGVQKIKTRTAIMLSVIGLSLGGGGSLAILLGSAANAISAPLSVTNGSFEQGTDPGSFTTVNAGDTNITGWTVTKGNVDYIGSYWQAEDGQRSIDMSGFFQAGGLSQTLNTVAGHTYTVTFWLAGNPDGGPGVKTLNVDTGGTATAYTFTVTNQTHDAMGWETHTYNFTATGSTTTLTFATDDASAYGPALDNVSVSDVLQNKDQCKNDGWKSYGVFKNQGDCVSFVATKGKNLPAGN